MANFLADILEALDGDTVESVVIIRGLDPIYRDYSYGSNESDPRDKIPPELLGVSLSWEYVSPLLNYEYDAGYGSMDCHDLYIYTATSIYYIHEYDGATSIRSIPRNP